MVTGCPGTGVVTVALKVPPAPVVTKVGETVAGAVIVSVIGIPGTPTPFTVKKP
jgi:hypothetical protein